MKLTFEVEAKDEQSWRKWRETVSPIVHDTRGAIVRDWYYEEMEEQNED
jgi:hypothetical protein